MSEEGAGKVEADSERLFLGFLVELDDSALNLSFIDAEHPHPVHSRTDLLGPSASPSVHNNRRT